MDGESSVRRSGDRIYGPWCSALPVLTCLTVQPTDRGIRQLDAQIRFNPIMSRLISTMEAFALLLLALTSAVSAENAQPDRIVVSRVNGQPVYARDVQRELDRVLRGREVDRQARKILQAQTIRQLNDRVLILEYLAAQEIGASRQDVDLRMAQIERHLAREQRTLEEYLDSSGMDQSDLRRAITWKIGWQRYLDRHLADEGLQKYFESNRRQFDGTQMHVAHILFRPESEDDVSYADAINTANTVADEIASGKLDFSQAAQVYSASPSGKGGGDIGLIRRHEPMPEAFSKAAFELEKGQTSGPVVTRFGVHLVHCLDIRPGEQTWDQVGDPLKRSATEYLFGWVADRQRPNAVVEFTGAMPYFKPGTRVLAEDDPQ